MGAVWAPSLPRFPLAFSLQIPAPPNDFIRLLAPRELHRA